MIRVIDNALNARHDHHLQTARRITTFIVGNFDTPSEMVDQMREAEMFFETVGRADRKLLDMPVLLIKQSDKNRVIVKAPTGRWVDVTEASDDEISDVAMGLSAAKSHQQAAAEAVGGLIGLLLGIGAEAMLDRNPPPRLY